MTLRKEHVVFLELIHKMHQQLAQLSIVQCTHTQASSIRVKIQVHSFYILFTSEVDHTYGRNMSQPGDMADRQSGKVRVCNQAHTFL